MSANRVRTPKTCRKKFPGTRSSLQVPLKASKVLAERNQAVVAVGAWVEDGQDFLEHPAVSLAFRRKRYQGVASGHFL